jgi:MoaA/NifB/PqqE/SkfB family radical SAM enzyme
MPFPIAPGLPFHAPDFTVLEQGGVFVAVDRLRAHWISTNRAGLRALRLLPGRTLDEAAPLFAAAQALPVEESARRLSRFASELARREFLSTSPIDADPATRGDSLRPVRLHEVWVVTNFECNLSCRHCYAWERVAADRRRIPAETLAAMMDDCRTLGAEIFYLTGGEPLMRDDLPGLVEAATRRSRAVLFTNGTLVTDALAAGLAAHRDRLVVQVSLEGPDEASNALLRGRGAFDRAVAGIRKLLAAGIRVGVSSTPTTQTAPFVPGLTRLLATLSEGGRSVEYHHIIYVLDEGNARKGTTAKLAAGALADVIVRCGEVVRQLRREGVRTPLRIANEKIFDAIASNGPRKDLCGAGATILGINAAGTLCPCATTMADPRRALGDLLAADGRYEAGTIGRLWREGAAARRVRAYTALSGDPGAAGDYRRFHGGGCWCHAPDPQGDIPGQNPFFPMYEMLTERAILRCATKDVPQDDPAIGSPHPAIFRAMARTRIACAGMRKTADLSRQGLDNGYCICFP